MYLRRCKTLFGELANALLNLGGAGLQPRRRGSLVGQGRATDTLSRCMHTSHLIEEIIGKFKFNIKYNNWGEHKVSFKYY